MPKIKLTANVLNVMSRKTNAAIFTGLLTLMLVTSACEQTDINTNKTTERKVDTTKAVSDQTTGKNAVNTLMVKGFKGSQIVPLSMKQQGTIQDQSWLFVSEHKGLMQVPSMAVDKSQLNSQPLSHNLEDPKTAEVTLLLDGEFELLAQYGQTALTYDTREDRVQPLKLTINSTAKNNANQANDIRVSKYPLLPRLGFEVTWICMQPRKQDGYLYAWFGSESGQSEQWLLASQDTWSPRMMRSQTVPVGSIDCTMIGDDLYVLEHQAGVWKIDASPFGEQKAQLVWPVTSNDFNGIASFNGQLLAVSKNGDIHNQQGLQWSVPVKKAQRISVGQPFQGTTLTVALFDDKSDAYVLSDLPNEGAMALTLGAITTSTDHIVEIPAWVESTPSDRVGDTMDDPAIWIHPTTPEKSLILGTNKRWGLLSFNMLGEQVQALPSGRINNVDLRQGVNLGGKQRDIAVATQRDHDALAFYEINKSGHISQYIDQATDMVDIYGMCLYQDEQNLYVFANEKSGRIAQYQVGWDKQQPTITLVRDIHTPSQVEGCVVDEVQHALFIGEEDQGIWRFDAKPNGSKKGKLIIKTGKELVADVEGISLYQDKDQSLLVVSSQGNNSYLVYQSIAPYAQVGRFRIGVNLEAGVDGSAETDGLAVTHLPVGAGPWQQGMLVVQDGRNRMPSANQSFKWLPWSSVAKHLN
ncbi:phytase [Shewanella sp. A14]